MMARKFNSKICILSLVSILVLTIFSIVVVDALGITLLCLQKGQVAKFSLCNSNMNDWPCSCSSKSCSCQICVNQISSGVYCPASPNACNIGSLQCTYFPTNNTNSTNNSTNSTIQAYVNVTLVSPADGYTTKTTAITFTYGVTNSSNISSCILYANGISVATNGSSKITALNNNKIVYTFSPGNYTWFIRCLTKSGNSSDSPHRNLVIQGSSGTGNQTTNISITLDTPANNSVATTGSINFVYDISDSTNITLCNLIINGNISATNTSAIINTQNNLITNLSAGNYNWSINCVDKSTKVWQSENRVLTVQDAVPPAPSGGGGVGGGGGGGGAVSSCLTKWNCSDWSNCENSIQTRICSYNTSLCKPIGNKPALNQSCVETIKNESIVNQTATSTNNTSSKNIYNNFLTGAAVVFSNKPLTIWGSIAIIVICVVLIFIIRSRSKKKSSVKKDEVKSEKASSVSKTESSKASSVSKTEGQGKKEKKEGKKEEKESKE